MSTVQELANIALEKLGIVEVGGTAETAHSNRALASLKSYLQKLINEGASGRLCDRIAETDETVEALENERIVHDGTATVILPTEVPYYYEAESYGIVGYVMDWSQVRPPMDLSVIEETRTDTGATKSNIYDNRLRGWFDINALTLDSVAPLSTRDEDGLASALAVRLATNFGQSPTEEMVFAAQRFEQALIYNWSQAGEEISPRNYF
jgi:hypothetical protein